MTEARSQAIAAAKEKATAMAKELGQAVGKPWDISEEGDYSDRLNFAALSGGVNGRYAYNSGGSGGGGDSTVAPGQVTVRASIRVSFQLE